MKEALRMALEALEVLGWQPTEEAMDYRDNAIDAIKKALAQPEQLEGLQLIHKADIDLAKKRAIEAQPEQDEVGTGCECPNCANGMGMCHTEEAQPEQEPVAWLLMNGEWPIQMIDHIDGNTSNNSWSNLRDVSNQVNQCNRHKAKTDSKSGLMGASPYRNKWRAQIKRNGVIKYLGLFNTAQEAHEAYKKEKNT